MGRHPRCKRWQIMPEQMEISEAAKSGDGTIANVGIKVNGKFKSPVNNQLFDTQEALSPFEVSPRSEEAQCCCGRVSVGEQTYANRRCLWEEENFVTLICCCWTIMGL